MPTRVQPFPIEPLLLLFQHHQRSKLIGPDLIEADPNTQLQRRPQIERAPQQQTRLGGLRRIELVQRAVVAPAAIVRSVLAEAGVAEFVAAERPMNQEPQGGLFRPLPVSQFGSPVSWNMPSKASIAAFTATAWWMIGTSPEYPSEDSSSFLKSVAAGARLMISSWRL